MVQLLYTYGVRGGQVRALRLEDIDWAKNQILFKASKHGKDSHLPLTAQVGESLLDYLQHSRPPSSYPYVFLTCRAPYHPFAHSSSLSAVVECHIRAAGIEPYSKGAHAFRHYAELGISDTHLRFRGCWPGIGTDRISTPRFHGWPPIWATWMSIPLNSTCRQHRN